MLVDVKGWLGLLARLVVGAALRLLSACVAWLPRTRLALENVLFGRPTTVPTTVEGS